MSTDATSVPCRVGTKRMLEIVNRICEGRGSEADVDRLVELGETIKETSLCGLGQTAPNPVLSTIRHFGYEYVEHIRDKRCRSGVCPAGLSCSYFLARLGYRPTVFEALARPGGMLVQAIPAYRLPREIVAREARMIERMGVEILTNQILGEDFTLKSLRAEGYDAVFLGVGAPLGVGLGIPGEDAEGITDALSFLRTYNLRGSVPVGKNVAVGGGGNSAIDAARTALRLGAEKVTVVYRRAREAMPAYEEEIEEAEHEGVVLKLLTAPIETVGWDKRSAVPPPKKREIRNPKRILMTEDGNPKRPAHSFVHSDLELLISFGFRVSYFGFETKDLSSP